MIDRIFAAVLTFCVLVGGTLAIAAAATSKDKPVRPSIVASAAPVSAGLGRGAIDVQRDPNKTDPVRTGGSTSTRAR